MQIGGEGIEKLFMNVVLKKNCKNTEIQKTQIHASFLKHVLNQFWDEIWSDKILWGL
jgi:hypothetical protein